jgi:hypothetical protein
MPTRVVIRDVPSSARQQPALGSQYFESGSGRCMPRPCLDRARLGARHARVSGNPRDKFQLDGSLTIVSDRATDFGDHRTSRLDVEFDWSGVVRRVS